MPKHKQNQTTFRLKTEATKRAHGIQHRITLPKVLADQMLSVRAGQKDRDQQREDSGYEPDSDINTINWVFKGHIELSADGTFYVHLQMETPSNE